MFPHPEITSQLGREHQRQMLAAARQRQLRRQRGRQAPKTATRTCCRTARPCSPTAVTAR